MIHPLRLQITGICLALLLTGTVARAGTDDSQDPVTRDSTTITLLFTNDFESAWDPTEAFWREDIKQIGGIAYLATLVDQIRTREPNVFLFDAGDIFTGTLARVTKGAIAFDLMSTIGYDAMTIGNHEFEYGWKVFADQKNRVSFPVLGANLFYRGTDHPYAQPFTIIERHGIRIGVIGILGQDAATALIPSHIAGVEVRAPGPVVTRYVRELRDEVDLIVLLTHQGKTAPMQTDDQAHPEIRRDILADIELAGVVDGIDVLFGGHADAGTRHPVIQPRTGTIIMQTHGQGVELGYLQLTLDRKEKRITRYTGKLMTVSSDTLAPHRDVQQKLDGYRARHSELYGKIGSTSARLNRQYNRESDLGNLFADIVRNRMDTPVGLIPSGALRKDLPRGDITRVDLLDAFPFTDRVATVDVSGSLLREILEQGLSLERGILQVSGLGIRYDSSRKPGNRLIEVKVGSSPLRDEATYRIATIEILAQGGDLYRQFRTARQMELTDTRFSEVLEDYFRHHSPVDIPRHGRLVDMSKSGRSHTDTSNP